MVSYGFLAETVPGMEKSHPEAVAMPWVALAGVLITIGADGINFARSPSSMPPYNYQGHLEAKAVIGSAHGVLHRGGVCRRVGRRLHVPSRLPTLMAA